MMRIRFLALAAALLAGAGVGGCSRQDRPAPDKALRERGKQLLSTYGCVACHQIQGLPTPKRTVGPPLQHIADNSYIGGVLPNNTDALVRWIMAPRHISPGTAMPELGVSAEEARAMATYLYSQ